MSLFLSKPIALQHYILAAQGYLELGMIDDALVELEHALALDATHEEILQLYVHILLKDQRWDEVLTVCENLRTSNPNASTGYLHAAFSLHELGRTKEAIDMLLSGPIALLREPVYFYNLGCYHAVLGNFEDAQNYLETSFSMDENFRKLAEQDPDLKMMKDKI